MSLNVPYPLNVFGQDDIARPLESHGLTDCEAYIGFVNLDVCKIWAGFSQTWHKCQVVSTYLPERLNPLSKIGISQKHVEPGYCSSV